MPAPARIALLFLLLMVGVLVVGGMLNFYNAMACFFSVFLLGVKNETFYSVQYWTCLIAGFGTAFFLMRRVWIVCNRNAR